MLEIALRGVLPPLVLAIVALLATRGGKRLFLVPAALAAGVFAAFVLLEQWPFPTNFDEAIDAKSGLVVMIGGTGLACLLPWPWAVRVLGVGLLALTVRFVLGGVFGWPESHPWAGWDTSQSSMHWGVGAGIWILSWLLTERHHEDRRSSLHWLVLSGMAGTAAFVLMQGGVASLAQLSGAVAVGMLILAFAAMARRDLGIDPGTALVVTVTVCGTLTVGNYLADTDTLAAALVVSMPLTLWIADRPGLVAQPRRRWLVTCGLFLALAGGAALRAWYKAPEPYY